MTDTELTQVFNTIHSDYFSQNNKIVTAAFHPYRSLRHTIEWNQHSIKVKVSQYFNDAPLEIVKITAIILLAKVYKHKIGSNLRKTYKNYTDYLQKHIPKPAKKKVYGYSPQGKYFDLAEIFDSLNSTYFNNRLTVTHLGWSKNKSYSRLGFYDQERDLLVISKIFDSKKVRQRVTEFLVYHEMLHILIPLNRKDGRRRIHTKEFREIEKKFPGYHKIDQWIKKNRHKL